MTILTANILSLAAVLVASVLWGWSDAIRNTPADRGSPWDRWHWTHRGAFALAALGWCVPIRASWWLVLPAAVCGLVGFAFGARILGGKRWKSVWLRF